MKRPIEGLWNEPQGVWVLLNDGHDWLGWQIKGKGLDAGEGVSEYPLMDAVDENEFYIRAEDFDAAMNVEEEG